jgi:hypothetical protein
MNQQATHLYGWHQALQVGQPCGQGQSISRGNRNSEGITREKVLVAEGVGLNAQMVHGQHSWRLMQQLERKYCQHFRLHGLLCGLNCCAVVQAALFGGLTEVDCLFCARALPVHCECHTVSVSV